MVTPRDKLERVISELEEQSSEMRSHSNVIARISKVSEELRISLKQITEINETASNGIQLLKSASEVLNGHKGEISQLVQSYAEQSTEQIGGGLETIATELDSTSKELTRLFQTHSKDIQGCFTKASENQLETFNSKADSLMNKLMEQTNQLNQALSSNGDVQRVLLSETKDIVRTAMQDSEKTTLRVAKKLRAMQLIGVMNLVVSAGILLYLLKEYIL